MALPQQVMERLSREPTDTPGWSFGLILFSGALLFIALAVYFGLTLGYEPYINGQINGVTKQLNALSQSISPQQESQLSTFYSEITNLRSAIANHVALSPFFAWLEKNTEANVYYTNLSITTGLSGNNVSLQGAAATEADVNQQMAIFEAAPEVKTARLSSVTFSSQTNNWHFEVALVMNSFAANQPAPQTVNQTQSQP